MFLRTRPAPSLVSRFLEVSDSLPLSYEPVGLASTGRPGFNVDELTVEIGAGQAAFARAREALANWQHFALGWLEVIPSGPIAVGTVAAVLIKHFGFWSLNGCRIVALADEPDRFSFSYGTLTNHAERGEELFEVTLDPPSGRVRYRIRAASRPRAALAYAGYPLARMLQARCRRESARAIARAIY